LPSADPLLPTVFTIAAAGFYFVGTEGAHLPVTLAILGACAVSLLFFWRVGALARVASREAAAPESVVI